MTNSNQNPGREFTKVSVGVMMFCSFMNIIARGMAETFAVFLLPVTGELTWSRGEFGSIYFVFMLANGLSAPFVGAIVDRHGPKAVYLSGVIVYGLGLLVASRMETLWQAMLGMGLMMGFGVAATGMTAASGLISRWFRRRISLAAAFAYAGLPIGMVVIVPATQLLIDASDWRTAYTVLGVVQLALAPLLLFLPWRRMADDAPHKPAAQNGRRLMVAGPVLRQPVFWGLFITLFMATTTIWTVMLQAVAYLVSIGYAPITAATVYGSVGLISIVGILGTGWACDRYGHRNVVTLSYLLTILGVTLFWLLGQNPSIIGLVAFVLVFGISMGSRGPAVSALVAILFPSNVAAVYGTVTIGLGLGGAVGGWASGLLYDLTGGYEAGFILSIVSAVIGITVFWIVRPLAQNHVPHGYGERV